MLAAPLACRHPQPGRIVLKAATAATLPVEADFTGVKATDEAMVRGKYKVIVECPNMGGWTASDGEGVGLIQDIAFIRTGTTGAPVGVAASRRGGVVMDRCAVFGFANGVTAREHGKAVLSNCPGGVFGGRWRGAATGRLCARHRQPLLSRARATAST